jgi:hypothetical protein
MADRQARLALFCAVGLALCVAQSSPSRSREWSGNEGSTTSGPTVDEYMKEAGPDAKFVQYGALKIGSHSVTCGKRPTVMYPNFFSWGGAFRGFIILNTKKIPRLYRLPSLV